MTDELSKLECRDCRQLEDAQQCWPSSAQRTAVTTATMTSKHDGAPICEKCEAYRDADAHCDLWELCFSLDTSGLTKRLTRYLGLPATANAAEVVDAIAEIHRKGMWSSSR
jgi:hypothetical protein